MESTSSRPVASIIRASVLIDIADFPTISPYTLKHTMSVRMPAYPPASLRISNKYTLVWEYLPHADEPAVGNLRFSVHWILTNVFATYADILTTASSTSPLDLASTYCSTLPYPYNKLYDAVSVLCLAPSYFRRGVA